MAGDESGFRLASAYVEVKPDLTGFADKAKAVPAKAEALVDAALAKLDDVDARLSAGLSKIGDVIDDANAGAAAVDEATKGLTNQ